MILSSFVFSLVFLDLWEFLSCLVFFVRGDGLGAVAVTWAVLRITARKGISQYTKYLLDSKQNKPVTLAAS